MTKFKFYLKRNLIATWKEAYINYNVLERLLKPLQVLEKKMIKNNKYEL